MTIWTIWETNSFKIFKSITDITNDIIHIGWQEQSKIEQSQSEKPCTIKIIKKKIFHFKTFELGIGIKSPVMT